MYQEFICCKCSIYTFDSNVTILTFSNFMDRHLLGEGAYGLSYRGGEFAQEGIKPRCGGVQNCEDTIVYNCKVLNDVSGNGYFNCREDLSK